MKEFSLANGCLIVPADWIVVNEEQAQDSRYAAVLEYWGNSECQIPYFICLYDEKKVTMIFLNNRRRISMLNVLKSIQK